MRNRKYLHSDFIFLTHTLPSFFIERSIFSHVLSIIFNLDNPNKIPGVILIEARERMPCHV